MADKDKNGGCITVDASAEEGDEVEVGIVPNSGFQLKDLSYTTASSGTFSAVYTDGTEVSTNIEIAEKPVTPTSPQTGDTSNVTVWFMMLALSAAGACTCFVFGKKSKKEQDPMSVKQE